MRFMTNEEIFNSTSPLALVETLANAFAAPFASPDRMHCDLPGSDDAKLLIIARMAGT